MTSALTLGLTELSYARLAVRNSLADALSVSAESQHDILFLSSAFELKELDRAISLLSQISPNTKCVIFSDGLSTYPIDPLLKLPIDDYFPSEVIENKAVLNARVKLVTQTPKNKRVGLNFSADVLGNSIQLAKLREEVALVRDRAIPILILGETGTGKELVARMLNYRENLARPLVAINCSSLPDSLAESELFGHSRGAFTSAVTARIGAFETAAGGDLFLDEVGELSLTVQAKLLRVLNDGTYTRLGETKVQRSTARIIAATNRNLEEMVKQGTFREDLFYRLNVYPISTPPLRERVEDILEIARYFLLQASKGQLALTIQGQEALKRHSFPGNVRELRSTIDRVNLIAGSKGIRLIGEGDIFPRGLPALRVLPTLPTSLPFKAYMNAAEKQYLVDALDRFPNKEVLAKNLGISRSKLFARLKQHGISN